jgi:hypothetical protein
MDGRTDNIEIQSNKDNKDNDRFTLNGKEVPRDAKVGEKTGDSLFRAYYQSLIGISMSDLEIGAKPAGKAELAITYYLKKAPGTMKIEFIPKDGKYYYALKNGNYTNMLVDKNEFTGII